jgi:integrase
MEYVQPIRSKAKIDHIKEILGRRSPRNRLMFILGINTGLRISDILMLTVQDIHNKQHIEVREQKTGKVRQIKINSNLQTAIKEYFKCYDCEESQKKVFDISRIQAYRIINDAARTVGLLDRIGTHTLRKTFGYHHYQKHKDVAILQNIFNHSSPSVTLRYIGVDADMMDESIDELDI